jgi:hypothetical protein
MISVSAGDGEGEYNRNGEGWRRARGAAGLSGWRRAAGENIGSGAAKSTGKAITPAGAQAGRVRQNDINVRRSRASGRKLGM